MRLHFLVCISLTSALVGARPNIQLFGYSWDIKNTLLNLNDLAHGFVRKVLGSKDTYCITPEFPSDGRFKQAGCDFPCNVVPGSAVPTGTILIYTCGEGYILRGSNESFCSNSKWHSIPTCVNIACKPLKSNTVDIICKNREELVTCKSNMAPGTTATLACKHSYKLPLAEHPGYREITCLETGQWDYPLFNCLPECGTSVAQGSPYIVNGQTTKSGIFPWHVAVYEKTLNTDLEQICAGTLISPDLVVSAAHCFYDENLRRLNDASKYAIVAGKHYRDFNHPEKNAQKSTVKNINIASRYYGMPGNYAADIAMVRLQNRFNLNMLVKPICMDWDNRGEREHFQKGKFGKIAGWGKTAQGIPSIELQEISLPFILYTECISAVPEDFKGYITQDKFCAGYLNGSSVCNGDSGGGLAFQIEDLWYLRGVVSVGPSKKNQCDYNYYTAFTNVGIFRNWIRDIFNQQE